MTPSHEALVIETQLVNVPDIGSMFRRVYRTPDGEELKVEYMEVHEAGSFTFPEEPVEEAVGRR